MADAASARVSRTDLRVRSGARGIARHVGRALGSDRVVGVPTYWNVFAHAAFERLADPDSRRSLAYRCEQILDRFGERCAFPLEDRG